MKRIVLHIGAMFCALSIMSVAQAAIVDFEDLGVAPGDQLNPPDDTVISSGGFDFINGPTSSIADLHVTNSPAANAIGTTAELLFHNDLIMTQTGGGTFSATSFDFGSVLLENPIAFSAVGDIFGGGTITQKL